MINSAQMLAQNSLETCLLFTNFLTNTIMVCHHWSSSSVGKQDSEGVESAMSLPTLSLQVAMNILNSGRFGMGSTVAGMLKKLIGM